MRACLLSFLIVLASGLAVSASTLTAGMWKEDPRLEKRVSVRDGCIFSGDLLDTLSAQSGVRLTVASPEDGAGDVVLIVRLKEIRLGRAMDALWSLLSYKGGAWHWARTGSAPNYEYTLSRSLGARNYAAQLVALIAESLAEEIDLRTEALDALPSDIPRYAARLGALWDRPANDPLVVSTLTDERALMGARILHDALGTDQLKRLVQTPGQSYSVLVGDLPERSRGYLRARFPFTQTYYQRASDGAQVPTPQRDDITFTNRVSGIDIAPTISARTGGGGYYLYAGGYPAGQCLAKRLFKAWMQDGDKETDPSETLPAAAPTPPLPQTARPQDRLLALADSAKVDMIMRRPMPYLSGLGPLERPTLREALAALEFNNKELRHKWNRGVLLVEYLPWIQHEQDSVSWRLVCKLRASAKAHDDEVAIPDLAAAAARWSKRQVRTNGEVVPGFQALLALHSILSVAASRPGEVTRLLSDSGAELDPDLRQAYLSCSGNPTVPGVNEGVRIRIRRSHVSVAKPAIDLLVVEFKQPSGTWDPVMGTGLPQWVAGKFPAPGPWSSEPF